MIWWSVEAFKNFDKDCHIILVTHPEYLENWDNLFGEEEKGLNYSIEKTSGGSTRIESVKNGLAKVRELEGNETAGIVVYVHDSARPLVTPEMIARGAEMIKAGTGAIPVIPVTDSIRKITPQGTISLNRNEYVAVQTPQIFLYEDIQAAYDALKEEEGLTDDASVAEKFGLKIEIFTGDPDNIKVTNPSDFKIF